MYKDTTRKYNLSTVYVDKQMCLPLYDECEHVKWKNEELHKIYNEV